MSEDSLGGEGEGGALLGLPELDNEVDVSSHSKMNFSLMSYACHLFPFPSAPKDLTQYNTAHNRQISTVGISDSENPRKRKHCQQRVDFSESEEVINPGKCVVLQSIITPITTPSIRGH